MKLIHNWRFDNLHGDIFGGITAAIVALPLALAFGVNGWTIELGMRFGTGGSASVVAHGDDGGEGGKPMMLWSFARMMEATFTEPMRSAHNKPRSKSSC